MVTHDRYFLERVCNEIIELDHGELYKYKGKLFLLLRKKRGKNFSRSYYYKTKQKIFLRKN